MPTKPTHDLFLNHTLQISRANMSNSVEVLPGQPMSITENILKAGEFTTNNKEKTEFIKERDLLSVPSGESLMQE